MHARSAVLVHGAYADGSSWSEVIPRLQRAGLEVVAVQHPLTTLEAGVDATRRALARCAGPTVLVGHSFGGTIISEAGTHPSVSALVYVAARAPDAGEDYAELARSFATGPASAGLVWADGHGHLREEEFVHDFANGLPGEQARMLYAVQGPISDTLFSERTTVAAWRTRPCWYAVSCHDRTIDPDLERHLAERMGAQTVEVDAGHLSMISHPVEIAALIRAAAKAGAPQAVEA
jgi:pimeloyl-ACP methyl ester carboxylesterase